MSSKYLEQINVKLSKELRLDLEDVASYEGVKMSELLRTWIRQRIQEIKQTRAYQNWLRKREGREEPKEED